MQGGNYPEEVGDKRDYFPLLRELNWFTTVPEPVKAKGGTTHPAVGVEGELPIPRINKLFIW